MTNYNDGNWHGWNGGECPVHPKSVVDAREEIGVRWLSQAENCDWHSMRGAFRVVKEYREPRECWAVGKRMHDSLADAEAFRARVDAANPGHGHLDRPITHWREVVE